MDHRLLVLAALAWMLSFTAFQRARATEPSSPPATPGPSASSNLPAFPDSETRARQRASDVVSGRSALVISGGTSLGVYEAGVLYYYTLLRAQSAPSPATVPFSVASGTSAGAINAFFSAIATCEAPTSDPRASPFWLWTEVDWNDLMDGPHSAESCGLKGALSRAPIRNLIPKIADRWQGTQWRECRVRFGAAVTHLTPRSIQLREGSTVFVSQLTEQFAIELSTPADANPGTPPNIRTIPAEHEGMKGLPLLDTLVDEPTTTNRRQRVAEAMELLLASSGIPGAFEPIPLRVKYPDGTVRTDCFIDGGVLDNVPLSTAVRLLDSEDVPGKGSSTYVYEDSDNVEWQGGPAPGPAGASAAQVGDASRRVGIVQLLDGLVTGTRQAELARTLEETNVQESLELPIRRHFITGQTFAAFGGFFDSSFRQYDFLAGIVDAEQSLSQVIRRTTVSPPSIVAPELPCFRAVWNARTATEFEGALSGPDCAALRVSPSDRSDDAKIHRDLWRLLKVIGSGRLDRNEAHLSRRFFAELEAVEGPTNAGWPKGYEYVTLRFPPFRDTDFSESAESTTKPPVAKPFEGLLAVRAQLNRLSNRVAGNTSSLLEPLVATAGREVVNYTVGYQKVPGSLSIGTYGRGLEVALAWRPTLVTGEVLGVDGVLAAQLADYGLVGKSVSGYTDLRLAGGIRQEVSFGLWQLLIGEFAVEQCGLMGHQPPLYRIGLSGRLELQLLQRLYIGGAYTRFLHDVEGWREHDISLALGWRFWL